MKKITAITIAIIFTATSAFALRPPATGIDTLQPGYLLREITLEGDILSQGYREAIVKSMEKENDGVYFLIMHKRITDEAKRPALKHEIYEFTKARGKIAVRALAWRDETAVSGEEDFAGMLERNGKNFLNNVSDAKNTPIITPGEPVFLSEGVLPKAWGNEVPFTMIESRYVADVTDKDGVKKAKLPDALGLFPESFGIDPAKNLILLKMLEPRQQAKEGDLYLEVHWEKSELYVVTDIDANAWPDRKGEILCGLNSRLMKQYQKRFKENWQYEYKKDFRAAVDEYRREIYEGYTARNLPAPEEKEAALRKKVRSFVGKKKVKVGDVLVFPAGTAHSLMHGITVAEVLTFHYERGILLPTRQQVTSFGGNWFIDEAFQAMAMSAYNPPAFRSGHLADFPLKDIPASISSQRVTIKRGASIDDSTLLPDNAGNSYHLLLGINGTLKITLEGRPVIKLAPKKAVIVPADAGAYTAEGEDSNPATYLKMFIAPEGVKAFPDPGRDNEYSDLLQQTVNRIIEMDSRYEDMRDVLSKAVLNNIIIPIAALWELEDHAVRQRKMEHIKGWAGNNFRFLNETNITEIIETIIVFLEQTKGSFSKTSPESKATPPAGKPADPKEQMRQELAPAFNQAIRDMAGWFLTGRRVGNSSSGYCDMTYYVQNFIKVPEIERWHVFQPYASELRNMLEEVFPDLEKYEYSSQDVLFSLPREATCALATQVFTHIENHADEFSDIAEEAKAQRQRQEKMRQELAPAFDAAINDLVLWICGLDKPSTFNNGEWEIEQYVGSQVGFNNRGFNLYVQVLMSMLEEVSGQLRHREAYQGIEPGFIDAMAIDVFNWALANRHPVLQQKLNYPEPETESLTIEDFARAAVKSADQLGRDLGEMIRIIKTGPPEEAMFAVDEMQKALFLARRIDSGLAMLDMYERDLDEEARALPKEKAFVKAKYMLKSTRRLVERKIALEKEMVNDSDGRQVVRVFDLFTLRSQITAKTNGLCVLSDEDDRALKSKRQAGDFYSERSRIISLLEARFEERKQLAREGRINELGALCSEEAFIYLSEFVIPSWQPMAKAAYERGDFISFVNACNIMLNPEPKAIAALTTRGEDRQGYRRRYEEKVKWVLAEFAAAPRTGFSDARVLEELQGAAPQDGKFYNLQIINAHTRTIADGKTIVDYYTASYEGMVVVIDFRDGPSGISPENAAGKTFQAFLTGITWIGETIPQPVFSIRKAQEYTPPELLQAASEGSQVSITITRVAHGPRSQRAYRGSAPSGLFAEWLSPDGLRVERFIPEHLIPASLFSTRLAQHIDRTSKAVPVYIEERGRKQLSFKIIDEENTAFDEIRQAYEQGQTLKVKITGVNSGGVIVSYKGIRGFIPKSKAGLSGGHRHRGISPHYSYQSRTGEEIEVSVLDPGRYQREDPKFMIKDAADELRDELNMAYRRHATITITITDISIRRHDLSPSGFRASYKGSSDIDIFIPGFQTGISGFGSREQSELRQFIGREVQATVLEISRNSRGEITYIMNIEASQLESERFEDSSRAVGRASLDRGFPRHGAYMPTRRNMIAPARPLGDSPEGGFNTALSDQLTALRDNLSNTISPIRDIRQESDAMRSRADSLAAKDDIACFIGQAA